MGQASTATCRPTLPRINRLPGCCRRAPSHCHERRGEGRSRVAQSGSSQRGEVCKASVKLAITNQHAPAQSQRRSRPRVLRPVAGSNELSSGADAGEETSARSRHCARARANAEFEPRRACHRVDLLSRRRVLLQDIGERTADERLEGHGPASVAACLTPIGREPGQPATCEGRPTGGVAWRKAGQLGAQLRGRTSGAYEVD